MKKLITEEALKKIIEELKQYVSQEEAKESKGYVIRNRYNNSEIYVSTKDNIGDAVFEAVVNKKISLSKANLHGVNLYGLYLSGADLSKADLIEANLSEADLSGADLSKANLIEANLSEADLSGADLTGADLYGANLHGANLGSAKFYGKGGVTRIKPDQVTDFLDALGFQVEE